MKIHLLLFAHGKEFICAKDRVKKQAIESNFFDNIVDIDTTQPPDFLSNFIAKNLSVYLMMNLSTNYKLCFCF